ncbi:MAG: hypothetical protein V4473_01520 [Patescibacteria group bacterium]
MFETNQTLTIQWPAPLVIVASLAFAILIVGGGAWYLHWRIKVVIEKALSKGKGLSHKDAQLQTTRYNLAGQIKNTLATTAKDHPVSDFIHVENLSDRAELCRYVVTAFYVKRSVELIVQVTVMKDSITAQTASGPHSSLGCRADSGDMLLFLEGIKDEVREFRPKS